MARRRLIIRDEFSETSVCWYPGTTDRAIENSIKMALGMHPGCSIKVVDSTPGSEGTVLAVNENLPDGLVVTVKECGVDALAGVPSEQNPNMTKSKTEDWLDVDEKKNDENLPLLSSGTGDGPNKPQGFQQQMLKFDRINAHLANERTWLAWIRTTLSLLSCAFTLQVESADASNSVWSRWLFITGALSIVCMEMTYFTGWIRYGKVKDILKVNTQDLSPKMGRLKLKYQTYFTFGLLVLIGVVYWIGGWNDFR